MRSFSHGKDNERLMLFAAAYSASTLTSGLPGVVQLHPHTQLNKALQIKFRLDSHTRQFQEFFYEQLCRLAPFPQEFPPAQLALQAELLILLPK
jgi:hypothetical protein